MRGARAATGAQSLGFLARFVHVFLNGVDVSPSVLYDAVLMRPHDKVDLAYSGSVLVAVVSELDASVHVGVNVSPKWVKVSPSKARKCVFIPVVYLVATDLQLVLLAVVRDEPIDGAKRYAELLRDKRHKDRLQEHRPFNLPHGGVENADLAVRWAPDLLCSTEYAHAAPMGA